MATKGFDKEAWIPTSCNGCFNVCAIKVHRKDGKVVGVKGDSSVLSSKGKVCGKSMARVADLYDPNRVTVPLKRTNPEKGIGVDPKWKEISWEEAMTTIVERLDKVRKDDPRKLVLANFDLCNMAVVSGFGEGFGTPNYDLYNATYCGSGLHTIFFLTLGTVNSEIDLERCNYMVLWGAQLGLGANNNCMRAIDNMAKARKRGARLVVIDPICGHAGAKADEWVPILPGTDGALALGMVNVLLNELGLYDAEFLKRKTNAPYLVRPDGRYARDPQSHEPLVWDPVEKKAKQYDAADVEDYALAGVYHLTDGACTPAFELLKQHVRKYSVEEVSRITTVPVDTIRRIAREFGEASQIGATIEMDGQTLPLRPAAIDFKRGVNAHKNGYFNCFSLQLLNIVVGAPNNPGGLLGTNAIGPYSLWRAYKGKDGLLTNNHYELARGAAFFSPYPPKKAAPPDSLNLMSLFPATGFLPAMPHFTMHDPGKFRLPYKPSALIMCRSNFIKSYLDPRAIADNLKKLDFILAFARQIDEVSEFADILLPEAHDFERYWTFPANQPLGFITPGPGKWYGQIVQPVVDPPPGVRNWLDVLMDIAERLGILAGMNEVINRRTGFDVAFELGVASEKLRPDKKYTVEEICKKQVEVYTGGVPYNDEMFRESAAIDFYPKSIEESFPGPFVEGRIPIYLEHLIDVGEDVKKVTKKLGMDWWDTSPYRPLADWRPCPPFESKAEGYDLFLANSKTALVAHSLNAENAWIDDVCKRHRMDHYILVHTSAAAKKGIKDGDMIWVESETEVRVKGKARVTECVHPKVVGTLGNLGGWARGKPIAKGKGIHSNSLIKFDWEMVDPVSGQIDTCARVKIYKAGNNNE
ncbi:molybdopterin-dependent oxidoreductase [Candidatus Poribacteria bacterium]|nr:molybdopterin-dependent oxidoreductase [Candidatus Poribacteria bacterium]